MGDTNDRFLTRPGIDRRKFLAGLGTGITAGVAGCQEDGGDATPTETDDTGDDDTDDDMETETETEEMMQGGTPTIGMAVAPTTLNPLQAGSVYEFYIIDRVMAYGTTNHPETLEFRPWAIEDWTLNPGNAGEDPSDPALADVTLRDDLTFHDGEDVTAEDLKFSMEYFRDQNPTESLTGAAHQVIDRVEMTGDYTVDVYMTAKDQRWFTNILGFPILPQHIWSDVDDFTQYSPRNSDEGLVGAGTWRLADFNWENWYELETVDDYPIPSADYVGWIDDEAPFVDGLRFEVFGSQNAMEQAVLSGEIDAGFVASGFTTDSAIQAENDESLTVHQASESGYNHISYNMRRTPFDDVAFRQFLNKAFDKQWVISEPYDDIGAVAGDYAVIPAISRWRPPEPSELADQGSFQAEGIDTSLLEESSIQSHESFPDLSFPGEPGTFNMTGEVMDGTLQSGPLKQIRDFLVNHSNAEHDYSFGEAQTSLTTAPDGKELYVNGEHMNEAHTNNAGEGGQGPLVFSFQPPQEDLYQSRYGQQFIGMLKKIGVPVEPKVKTINAQIPTVYVQEDFDMYSMGWGLGVNVTHFSSLYSGEGADLTGETETGKFNAMGYTGADPLIERDRSFMDFSRRTPVVKQICAEIYRDAPTNITDVAQLLEPTNDEWEGWIGGLGTTVGEDSFLNIRRTG